MTILLQEVIRHPLELDVPILDASANRLLVHDKDLPQDALQDTITVLSDPWSMLHLLGDLHRHAQLLQIQFNSTSQITHLRIHAHQQPVYGLHSSQS